AEALVSAMTWADSVGVPTTIRLAPACTYTLTAPFGGSPNGLPAVTGSMVLEGNGSAIVRGPVAPPFRILEIGGTGTLELDQMTISGGFAPAGLPGGGVANAGTLAVTGSTIAGNAAGSGAAGVAGA